MAKLASCLPFTTMIILHSFFVLACSLTSLSAAAAAAASAGRLPHSFSFQLHLRHPPSELSLPTLSSSSMPLIPKLFSDLPLTALNCRHAYNSTVGSASGLYLYDAASAELRFFYFTATLDLIPNGAQSGISSHCSAGGASCSGSLVLMGNVDSGAISVVGGTRDFAFGSGQANVTIIGLSPPSSSSSDPGGQLISFDVELQYEEVHNSIAPLL